MDPLDKVDQVSSRLELAEFLEVLGKRVADKPTEIENITLASFIDAAAAWGRDMDGYFTNQGLQTPHEPSWSLVAAIFDTAVFYE